MVMVLALDSEKFKPEEILFRLNGSPPRSRHAFQFIYAMLARVEDWKIPVFDDTEIKFGLYRVLFEDHNKLCYSRYMICVT